MKWLLFFYPWLELWSLIELGSQTSVSTAMLWVLGGGVVGIAMFRLAGRQALNHLQNTKRGRMLSQHLLMGDVAILVSGILLVVPGLISDLLAIAVLIAPLRVWFVKQLMIKSTLYFHDVHDPTQSSRYQNSRGNSRFEDEGVTVEGEFQSVSADAKPAVPLDNDKSHLE